MGFFSKLFGGGGDESYAGQELSMQDFSGKDLSGKDFSKAELTSCNFRGANLTGANFRGAQLMSCDFTGANLTNACLDEAECMGAIFTGANMTGVSTFKTDLMAAEGVAPSAYSKLEDIMEDDQKWPLMRQKLETLAAIAPGGAVRERRDDNEIFYAGAFRGRNFRIKCSVHGSLELEVKVRAGNFSVYFDREAKPTHDGDADPVWGDDSSSTKRHFFGPGVYIEGRGQEFAALKQSLSDDMPNMFAHFLPAANVERFDSHDDEMSMEFKDDLLSGDFPQRMRVALEFIDSVARARGA